MGESTNVGNSAHSELKHLQVQEGDLSKELQECRKQLTNLHGKIDKLCKQKEAVSNRILKLTKEAASVVVSEHAILRYLERVQGLDLEAIKSKILPEETKAHLKVLGNGVYTTATHKLKVRDNVVITIITNNEN